MDGDETFLWRERSKRGLPPSKYDKNGFEDTALAGMMCMMMVETK
jgi:hypothetical protein